MSEFENLEKGPDYSQYLQGTSWELPFDLTIPDIVEQAEATFGKTLKEQGWDDDVIFDLGLGFREALLNALKYGKPESNDGGEAARVRISFFITPERIEVNVQDPGKGFKWRDVADPRTKQGQNETHLRGIFLMQKKYDFVRFNDKGNEVHMEFGDEGILQDNDPEKLVDSLPERLKGIGARTYKAHDGTWRWHAEATDMRNKKERDRFMTEEQVYDETS